jgi:hypothetical protein
MGICTTLAREIGQAMIPNQDFFDWILEVFEELCANE